MSLNDNTAGVRATVYDTGVCGESLRWVLIDNTLEILGSGDMTDYISPWYAYRSLIEKIYIEDGVTSIGQYAFYQCAFMREIEIPDSVSKIGDYSFYSCDSLKSITLKDNVTHIGAYAFKDCCNLAVICKKGSYVDGFCSDKRVKLIYR